MKNKLIIGLLLVAQVSGIIAENRRLMSARGEERAEIFKEEQQRKEARATMIDGIIEKFAPNLKSEHERLKAAMGLAWQEILKISRDPVDGNCLGYNDYRKPSCAKSIKKYSSAWNTYDAAANALLSFENNVLANPKQLSPEQLNLEYSAYLKAINTYNNQQSAKAYAHQMKYIQQHPNQPIKVIDIAEMEPMSFNSWLHYGKPQR